MKSGRRLTKIICMTGAVGLMLSGCQPTPEKEPIAQKEDINSVVEQYAADETTATEMSAESDTGASALADKTADETKAAVLRASLGVPETTSFEVAVDNDYRDDTVVRAENVPVIVPNADKLGALAVQRNDLSIEQLERIGNLWFGELQPYERAPQTKEDYQRQIEDWQQQCNQAREDGAPEDYLASMESTLDMLQQEMAAAPSKADIVLEPMVYEWSSYAGVNGLESIYGEAEDAGVKHSFSAQKEASFFMVSASKMRMEGSSSVNLLSKEALALRGEAAVPADELAQAFANNQCTYTEDEAVALCLDFLKQCQIDTTYLEISAVKPLVAYDYMEDKIGSGIEGYEISLGLGLGGAAQTLTSNPMDYVSEESAGVMPYSYEQMYMQVENSGITTFFWNNPMAAGEVLADSVELMPYEEIEDIITQHISLVYETYRNDERLRNGESLNIDYITLGLMRIKNENDEENYTLIPVWDVFSKELGTYSLVTVNAMDGSIISRAKGY